MSNLVLSDRVTKLEPSATIAMTMMAKQLRQKGVDVVSMTAGEPDFDTPDCIVKAAKQALNEDVHHYTAVKGNNQLLQSMRNFFKNRKNLDYGEKEVISSIGAKASLSLAIDAILQKGDEAIIFAPYWVSYPSMIQLAQGKSVIVNTSANNNFLPKIDDIKKAINSKTKLIILNSPSNPTGIVWPKELLQQIMDLVKGTGIWVLSDEIYEHLVYDDAKHYSPASFSQDAKNRTLVISGLSKGYAMTGWRVGIAAGPQLLVDAMAKLQGQRFSCVTGVAQAAAAYALNEPSEVKSAIENMRQSYDKRRKLFSKLVINLPYVKYQQPNGAFYAFIGVSELIKQLNLQANVKNDLDLSMKLLQEAHVATVPGTPFGSPGSLRLSLACSENNIKKGVERIAAWIEKNLK